MPVEVARARTIARLPRSRAALCSRLRVTEQWVRSGPSHRMTIANLVRGAHLDVPSSQDFLEQSLNGDIKDVFAPRLNVPPAGIDVRVPGRRVKPTGPTTTLTPSSRPATSPSRWARAPRRPASRDDFRALLEPALPLDRRTRTSVGTVPHWTAGAGVPIRWTSPSTFQTVLRVPETAWLRSATAPYRHIRCARQLSGRDPVPRTDLGMRPGPGDAHTTLTLKHRRLRAAKKDSVARRCISARRAPRLAASSK